MSKIRVNITVDSDKLEKVKQRLHLFGGKLSTLFNAYLDEFIQTMDKEFSSSSKEISNKISEIEERLRKLEKKSKN